MASGDEDKRFKLLAENNLDMICRVGPDLIMQYASLSCERILGWTQGEMCGKGPDTFVLAEDLPIVAAAHEKLMMEGFDRSPTTIRMRKKDGGFAWIEVNARLMRDTETGEPADIVLTMRDVTARKLREEALEAQLAGYAAGQSGGRSEQDWINALRESEERFSKAFRLARTPMAILTLDGLRILDVNDAFMTVRGHATETAVGRTIRELNLIVGPGRVEAEKMLRQTRAIQDVELRIALKAGDPMDCLVSTEEMSFDGRPCILMVLQDVTEQRRSETDLVAAIEAVVRDAQFGRNVVEKLAQIRRSDEATAPPAQIGDLTRRELEILGRISQGQSDEKIAHALAVSRNTVRNHVASIYGKIGVHRRSEAVVWGRERGLTGRP
ncbi:PAS domain S-box protein [Bradyrhizobium sp. ISRA442]|uniref:PAS domain S-box protein n=1 Tax=Bradyrhizobium sp. ISRA442 TaxID=2866197 RepID=UPI00311AF475